MDRFEIYGGNGIGIRNWMGRKEGRKEKSNMKNDC